MCWSQLTYHRNSQNLHLFNPKFNRQIFYSDTICSNINSYWSSFHKSKLANKNANIIKTNLSIIVDNTATNNRQTDSNSNRLSFLQPKTAHTENQGHQTSSDIHDALLDTIVDKQSVKIFQQQPNNKLNFKLSKSS